MPFACGDPPRGMQRLGVLLDLSALALLAYTFTFGIACRTLLVGELARFHTGEPRREREHAIEVRVALARREQIDRIAVAIAALAFAAPEVPPRLLSVVDNDRGRARRRAATRTLLEPVRATGSLAESVARGHVLDAQFG